MAREEVAVAGEEAVAGEGGGLLLEIVGSPLNLSLLGLCLFLLYQILRGERPAAPAGEADPPPLPKMKRRDFTLEQLRPFDGVSDPRILMAVNGKVFDVTRAKKFYGPGEGGRGAGRARPGHCAGESGSGPRRGQCVPSAGSSAPAEPIRPRCPAEVRTGLGWLAAGRAGSAALPGEPELAGRGMPRSGPAAVETPALPAHIVSLFSVFCHGYTHYKATL